jgi:hypothetical protein
MVDPWIEKAWHMQRDTECFPNITILKAALWLEKKQKEASHYDTAAVISLHYLVLALRKKGKGGPYCVSICFSSFNVEAGSDQPAGSGHLSELIGSFVRI